jgi:hypothetical protein
MRPVNAPLPLLPHVSSPLVPVLLTVQCRLEPRELLLHFRLRGDAHAVRWPVPAGGGRADGLWQHTCFEAFVASEGAASYHEFNFSPAGQWAHYAFRAERERAADPLDAPPPLIDRLDHADGVDLIAVVERRALPPGPWRIGLSAVLEDTHGRIAHCALHHPKDKPDFHDRAGWTLRLPEA